MTWKTWSEFLFESIHTAPRIASTIEERVPSGTLPWWTGFLMIYRSSFNSSALELNTVLLACVFNKWFHPLSGVSLDLRLPAPSNLLSFIRHGQKSPFLRIRWCTKTSVVNCQGASSGVRTTCYVHVQNQRSRYFLEGLGMCGKGKLVIRLPTRGYVDSCPNRLRIEVVRHGRDLLECCSRWSSPCYELLALRFSSPFILALL